MQKAKSSEVVEGAVHILKNCTPHSAATALLLQHLCVPCSCDATPLCCAPHSPGLGCAAQGHSSSARSATPAVRARLLTICEGQAPSPSA